MKRCPHCNGSISRLGNRYKPFFCPNCKEWFSEPEVTPKQTNADLIRSMTDEELAEFLDINVLAKMSNGWKNWLDWLKQEAGE